MVHLWQSKGPPCVPASEGGWWVLLRPGAACVLSSLTTSGRPTPVLQEAAGPVWPGSERTRLC